MRSSRAELLAALWTSLAALGLLGCVGELGPNGAADPKDAAATTSVTDDDGDDDGDTGGLDAPDAAGAGGASFHGGGGAPADAGGSVADGGSSPPDAGAPPEPDAGGPTGPWGLPGPVVPRQGQPRPSNLSGNAIDWAALPATGSIGKNSADQDILVFVRDACPGQAVVRTVVIGASIHASENGGQTVAHELLFNKQLPPDVRIVVIPEINKAGLTGQSPSKRYNKNGVNLNRNFDFKWDQAKQGDVDAANPNYKGPSPASEPETQAIQSFLLTVGPAALVISYHRNLNWVAPSGPNASKSRPLALKYAQLAKHPSIYNNYGYGFFEAWYAAKTDTPALLVELSSSTAFDYLDRHANAVVGLLSP